MSIPLKNSLCKQIEKQFERSLQDYGIQVDEKILVAVSGGLDSTVLAHLCKHFNLNFHLIHMNYGLRGEASDQDAQFCHELAKKMNSTFICSDVKKSISAKVSNLQSVARELRYTWFENLLAEYNSRWVLTGHHLDDHAETLIHQFIRGGGPDTLTGFFHGRKNVARPLMMLRRSDILQYAKIKGIDWREDESNSIDHYTRNRIRHSLLPTLKEYNNGIAQSIIKRAKTINNIIEYAADSMQRELNDKLKIQNGFFSVDASWLRSCKYKELFIYTWCSNAGVSHCDIDAVLTLLKRRRGELSIGSMIFRLTAESLQLMPAPEPLDLNTHITIPFRWEGSNLTVELLPYDPAATQLPWAIMDKYWLDGHVILRNWKPADRFIPSGMIGSKKVGDFLTHKKIPISERSRILVIEREGEILALLGHRLSEQVCKVQNPESAIGIYLR